VANAKGGTTKSTESSLTSWLAILALNIVQILLSVVGYVSLGYIIYGGFKYMTQGDNSSGTAGARKTIQNAVIGLVIAIMSVAIISFISNRI
jgi:threonine/homoserine/homoserine lactone efflux protein